MEFTFAVASSELTYAFDSKFFFDIQQNHWSIVFASC